MAWDDAKTSRVVDLWREGYTAQSIADILNDGTTRNAVLGKLDRMGLHAGTRGTRVPQARFVKPTAPRAEAPRPSKAPEIASALPAPVAMVQVAHGHKPQPVYTKPNSPILPGDGCKWPIGEPMTHYCDAPRTTRVYCAEHHARAYQPARPLKERELRHLERTG